MGTTIRQRAGRIATALHDGHQGKVTLVGSLIMFGLIAWVISGHWDEFATAIVGVPVWVLVAATLIQVLALIARSESWKISVDAADGTASRLTVYRAAAVGYVGNIVNGQLGFAMRIAALRRSAPDTTPKAGALATTEVPILIVEGGLAALFSFTLVTPLDLAWWVPLLAFVVMFALLVGLRWIARHRHTGWWKGVAVMRDARTRTAIIVLITAAMGGQVIRNWILLEASGVSVTVLEATAVLIAVAVLGALPIGPGTGAGAAMLILGADGVGAVAAAGVLLTATSAAGSLTYGAWALAVPRWPAALKPHVAVQRRRAAAARASTAGLLARLRELPAHQRRAIEHAYFGGLDHARIAAALA